MHAMREGAGDRRVREQEGGVGSRSGGEDSMDVTRRESHGRLGWRRPHVGCGVGNTLTVWIVGE
jgi:hypothetical protein